VKWRVSIRPRAEMDLQQAWQWYEREQSGLGDKFLAEMRELIQSLHEYAERTPEYYRGFHRLLAPRFPHKIFYRIQGDRVIVFLVLHTTQHHPNKLRG
jgi:plasmid stabilization system protein ParE